jgi:hypothetical protein
VPKVAFSRPFCLAFTLKTSEVGKRQRHEAERAKKCDAAKTLIWAGATPILGAFSRPTLRGVAPARHACCVTLFWPRAEIGANSL